MYYFMRGKWNDVIKPISAGAKRKGPGVAAAQTSFEIIAIEKNVLTFDFAFDFTPCSLIKLLKMNHLKMVEIACTYTSIFFFLIK